ncbi:3-oxoacyl-ACP reductase FabG [Blautia producta]|uniref:3-oxoacyl-ACP reductase FabG n=1 Tax=Blautia producta TaxID=33035 RepID=UPI002109B4E3|nr:3-oxoacyl-ACP reductase FabG [Blautia producta]MCQ4744247.1 3-oxoacyl-ACP reductase FabG [Blautia producta]
MLTNKKVIITGGCKGIGKCIAEKFLEENAYVSVTYWKSKELAELTKAEFAHYGEKFNIYQMDVSDMKMVYEVMSKIQNELGGVDILINNAGIIKDSILYSMSEEDWDQVIKTNLYGCFYTIKSVLYNMIKQRSGSIINISSVSGIKGIPGQTNYCASKAGIIGLTKALAEELSTKNIRVNAIAPGYVKTDMIAELKSINGKIIFPEQIANVAKFLATEESNCINGEVIVAGNS